MKRVLLQSQLPAPDRPARLPEAEARHLVGVLRLRDGELVEALDGRGHAALAKLRLEGPGGPHGESAWLDYAGPAQASADGGALPLQLELALLKADAMSWVIEKAVELGVTTFVPVVAEHCVVKTAKGPDAFRERWQRIADQALKQCGRLEGMTVETPRALTELAPATAQAPRLYCDEGARREAPGLLERVAALRPRATRLSLLVGPEGGWSAGERARLAAQAETFAASLGPCVLRAETAAVFAASVAGAAWRWPAGLADSPRKS